MNSDEKNLQRTERVNVSKLIYANERTIRFQRQGTSVPIVPGARKSLTASASPTVYYVSLTETSEVVLQKPRINE